MRWKVGATLVLLSCTSGRRIPPSLIDDGEALRIDGTWWIAAGLDGPVQARLEIERGLLELHPIGGRPRIDMNISADGDRFEARAATGAVLSLAERPGEGLVVYGTGGRVAYGFRVGPPVEALAGRWSLRVVQAGVREVRIVLRPEGQPSLITTGGVTDEIWPLVRPEVAASWVRVTASDRATIEVVHPAPEESWIVQGPPGDPTLVLHRVGARPRWLPPPPESADAPPSEPERPSQLSDEAPSSAPDAPER